MEPSLLEAVRRFLPPCEQAVAVNYFVESWSDSNRGLVAQAFAAAVKDVMSEWHMLPAKLERQLKMGGLTLQSAWYCCQPTTRPIQALFNLCHKVAGGGAGAHTGPSLLNLIHDDLQAHAGDTHVRKLMSNLLHSASVPYARALRHWLSEGIVDDPHGEFAIIERGDIREDSLITDYGSSYWHHKYKLREPLAKFLGTLCLTP